MDATGCKEVAAYYERWLRAGDTFSCELDAARFAELQGGAALGPETEITFAPHVFSLRRFASVALLATKTLGASLFEQRKVLGRGGFGTIIKAVRRDTGLTVALKEVRCAFTALAEAWTKTKADPGGGRGSTEA